MLIKTNLERAIRYALRDAYSATFRHGITDEGRIMADAFANSAAPKLASAIDEYIKSATILGGNVTTAGTPAAQSGPITTPPKIS